MRGKVLYVPRLFVAIEIPAEIKKQLVGSWEHAGLRPISIENMHLTLAFLGEANLGAVTEALGQLQSSRRRLELETTTWGTFPRTSSARVLWVGVSGGAELLDLVARIRRAADSVAPHMDRKPFSPHITLARAQASINLSGLKVELNRQTWGAAEFSLIESKLARPRAIYDVVKRFAL